MFAGTVSKPMLKRVWGGEGSLEVDGLGFFETAERAGLAFRAVWGMPLLLRSSGLWILG